MNLEVNNDIDESEQAIILPKAYEKETFIEEEFILTEQEIITHQMMKVLSSGSKGKEGLENSQNIEKSPQTTKKLEDEEEKKKNLPNIIFSASPKKDTIENLPSSFSSRCLLTKSPLLNKGKIVEKENPDSISSNIDFNVSSNSMTKNETNLQKYLPSPANKSNQKIREKNDDNEEYKADQDVQIIDNSQKKANELSIRKKTKVKEGKSNKSKKEKNLNVKKLQKDLDLSEDKNSEMRMKPSIDKNPSSDFPQNNRINKNSLFSNTCNAFKFVFLKNVNILPKSKSNSLQENWASFGMKDKETKLTSEINQINQALKTKESELSLNNKILDKYKKFVEKLKNESNLLNLKGLVDSFTNKINSKKENKFNDVDTNSKFQNDSKNLNESSNIPYSQEKNIKINKSNDEDFSKNMSKIEKNSNFNSKNKEVKFQNELIKNSAIKLVDDSIVDYLLDKRFLEMDDINTEFPKKVINIMKILINKIKSLVKDEYGDSILDLKSNSRELNEIREISYILIKLLKTLFIQKDSILIVPLNRENTCMKSLHKPKKFTLPNQFLMIRII